MEDDNEDDDFQIIKRRRTTSNDSRIKYGKNAKEKRGLPLSLKSSQSKNKACSIRTFLEKKDVHLGTLNDKLTHCPVCQLPSVCLIGQSIENHVQKCVTSYTEPSVLCPSGINCNSTVFDHFTQYSHCQLASLRSAKTAKYKTSQEEIHSTSKVHVTELKAESTVTHAKCSLSNSINTNFLNLKTNDSNFKKSFFINTLSQNTINDSKQAEQLLPMFEDIVSTENPVESQTQSSEKENFDDFSHWLDDGLEHEDFEISSADCTTVSVTNSPYLNPAKCPGKITSTDTTATSTNVVTSSSTKKRSNTATVLSEEDSKTTYMEPGSQWPRISESVEEKFQCPTSPATQKGTTNKVSLKQKDIGEYFGLKPKHNLMTNRANVSGQVLQPKRFLKEQTETQYSGRKPKKCPFYKIVEGTSFAVDAFSYGHIPEISAYFLSHFHYDHYGGLKRSFSKPIYCSQITANLILLKIKVPARFIHSLSVNTPYVIQGIEITLLDANHCPGAVMFLFKLPNGQTHLHTGDFRASRIMEENPKLSRSSIHTLYLDTTYCDPSYSFPPQSEAVEYCVWLAKEAVARNAKTLIVVGTYTIGKEKIFIEVGSLRMLGAKKKPHQANFSVNRRALIPMIFPK